VTELAPTRYDLAAARFGCHAEHIEEPRDLVPALERALASGKAAGTVERFGSNETRLH
jgi:acetolactate synthase-1/2/3 large subunit